MMDDSIKIKNLCVSFGSKKVLRGLNLTIQSPGSTCLVGPNGSGKTTLIHAMLRFLPYTGKITFGGHPLSAIRKRIGIVLDEPPFYGSLTARMNLRLLMDANGQNAAHGEKIFQMLKIDESILKTKADQLSFGQRHRLAVAGAILRNPQYLFLDEPSVGLDAESLASLTECLKAEVQAGKCLFITSHDFEFVHSVADNVALLSDGICGFSGTKEEYMALAPQASQRIS